jgi:hypothetical protein
VSQEGETYRSQGRRTGRVRAGSGSGVLGSVRDRTAATTAGLAGDIVLCPGIFSAVILVVLEVALDVDALAIHYWLDATPTGVFFRSIRRLVFGQWTLETRRPCRSAC